MASIYHMAIFMATVVVYFFISNAVRGWTNSNYKSPTLYIITSYTIIINTNVT